MTIAGVQQSRQIMEQASIAAFIKKEHIGDGSRVTTRDEYVKFVRSYGRTSFIRSAPAPWGPQMIRLYPPG